MKSDRKFTKPEDWDRVPESRYTKDWFKQPFPEFEEGRTVSKQVSQLISDTSLILSQYEFIRRTGFDGGLIAGERKSE